MAHGALVEYMADCRELVVAELERLIPRDPLYRGILYDLVLEYPLREAKALRPSLCVATCRALGGSLHGVTKSATVLELYHNAFLVHDDVEDGSELRRDRPTLHRAHGVAIAINVGDAMLALALEPLLENMKELTLGKALKILQLIARMARESAEGQALELSWIRQSEWSIGARDYVRMVYKKTGLYTFVTPVAVGALVADAPPVAVARLRRFATALGVAFQIKDDVLNLVGDETRTGKEAHGDLWEGKHTLVLIHALSQSTAEERREAVAILRKRRPRSSGCERRLERVVSVVDGLEAVGALTPAATGALRDAIGTDREGSSFKTADDIAFLRRLIDRQRSIEHASRIARKWARRAARTLDEMSWIPASVHRDFLHALTDFVIERDH